MKVPRVPSVWRCALLGSSCWIMACCSPTEPAAASCLWSTCLSGTVNTMTDVCLWWKSLSVLWIPPTWCWRADLCCDDVYTHRTHAILVLFYARAYTSSLLLLANHQCHLNDARPLSDMWGKLMLHWGELVVKSSMRDKSGVWLQGSWDATQQGQYATPGQYNAQAPAQQYPGYGAAPSRMGKLLLSYNKAYASSRFTAQAFCLTSFAVPPGRYKWFFIQQIKMQRGENVVYCCFSRVS